MSVEMVASETLVYIFYNGGKGELCRTMLDMAIVIITSQCSQMDRYNVSFIDDCHFLVSYMMAHVASATEYVRK